MLHESQSACRKKVSCADAIFATQEVIARSRVFMCLYKQLDSDLTLDKAIRKDRQSESVKQQQSILRGGKESGDDTDPLVGGAVGCNIQTTKFLWSITASQLPSLLSEGCHMQKLW